MNQRLIGTWGLAGAACAAIVFALSGCGSGGASKAPVKGKVTYKGQPVSGGSVSLTPAAELKATIAGGEVGTDGSFVLSTDKTGDGAAIGKHTVNYTPPPIDQPAWDGYGTPPPQPPPSPYAGLAPMPLEFEVKAGQNELNIELGPPAATGYGGVPGR